MCGRFIGFSTLEQLVQYFPIDVANVEASPNYNVAPTQEILAIVRHDDDDLNHLEKLFWGLVPFWAKDAGIGSRMINARSETVASKPSFRAAFRQRRCLIPADGFFEWKATKESNQPMLITLPNQKPFAFAGLWETWDDHGKREVPYRSCTILTRDASESVMPIHNRMPVILRPEAFGPWLDPDFQDVDRLQGIIETQVRTELVSYPVSKAVNSVKNNRPENIEPVKITV
jgi:putative SOS response-associated peptidase YedK